MVDANRHASIQMAHLNALASLDIRCPLIRKRAKVSTFTAANLFIYLFIYLFNSLALVQV